MYEHHAREDIDSLYDGFLRESARVLRRPGKAVVLTALAHFENLLCEAVPDANVIERLDLLVNGRKARAVKFGI